MELKRQLFRQNLLRSRAFTQITLDDDCIVKDNKPDLLNIIHTRGSVIFEDVKVSSQTVWVTGQLRFVVLYRSEDNRLESFTDSINFGEKIFMDEVEERDTVNLSGDLEDLNISAINSRKLAVRALLGIHAVCEVPVEEEIVSDEAVGADFEETMEFVERSQIDAVAPAIGTAHGIYHGVPKINFELVEKLGKEKTPVVIHGGSGLSAETFTRLIELGGRKVNISTLVKNAYLDKTKELILSGEKFAPIPFDTEVENAVKEEVKKHLEVFSGKRTSF